MTTVFVLNVERDTERRESVLAQLSAQTGLEPRIVPGVYGPALADIVCLHLTADAHNWISRKGTIGCFLSHVAAWERVARLDAPAIVLEDDADAPNLWKIADLEIPSDAELIFLNNRMSAEPNRSGNPVITPMLPTLIRLNDQQVGPGGDGYWLTPRAATKLLDACAVELYFGHVDGRLLRYSVSSDDLASFPEETWLGYVLRMHRNYRGPGRPPIGIIRGYCIAPALVWQGALARRSVRSALDALSTNEK